MGFLAPLLLTLGVAVSVPLILHLLQREQGPRVIFPAMRYLQRAERENARRIRLRQILLMALRLGLIILLVLAAARPFLRSGGTDHEPTAVAIILDNSPSTGLIVGEERVLDQLKARALETLSRARPEDRFWVLRAGAPWEPAVMSGPREAISRVEATEVSAGSADLISTIERARALLATGAEGRPAEIHLLTDLQANSFAGSKGNTGAGPTEGPPLLIWGPTGPPPANLGITRLEIGGGIPPRIGERSTLSLHLEGESERDTVSARLVIGDRVVATSRARIGEAVPLPLPSRQGGIVQGYVEIEPDDLRADDLRYFVYEPEEPPVVGLYGSPPFLAEALAVLHEAGRVQLAQPGEEADIVIATGGIGLEGLPEGGVAIVVPPASRTELPALNQRLGGAGIPWRYHYEPRRGEGRLDIEALGSESLASLGEARIRDTYELRGESGAEGRVLIREEGGSPWILQGELPDGRGYILLASPLTEEATTVPTSPALIPLLDQMIGAWASRSVEGYELAPGEVVELPEGSRAILRPDGVREELPEGTSAYRVPGRAGIYEIYGEEGLIHAFAVNPSPLESDLRRIDDTALRNVLAGWEIERVENPAEWTATIFRERHGREIWRPILLIALAILLIEGLVASSGVGGRRDRDPNLGPKGGGKGTLSGIPAPATGHVGSGDWRRSSK